MKKSKFSENIFLETYIGAILNRDNFQQNQKILNFFLKNLPFLGFLENFLEENSNLSELAENYFFFSSDMLKKKIIYMEVNREIFRRSITIQIHEMI